MKTDDYKTAPMRALHALVRYQTHGGYTWAAMTMDNEILCTECVRDNYRQIFRSTRDELDDGWGIVGLMNSGETEPGEICCSNCNETVWDTSQD